MQGCNRRELLAAGVGVVLIGGDGRGKVWAQDKPGQELPEGARIPAALQPLLPPFTASLFDPPSAAQGWGPVSLSPTGKYFLAQRRQDESRGLYLLDAQGETVQEVITDETSVTAAGWGLDDTLVHLETRKKPGGSPTYQRRHLPTGRSVVSKVAGLPLWPLRGKTYLVRVAGTESPSGGQALPGHWQRYTATDAAVGAPLQVLEPTWSADGKWLAYLRPKVRGPMQDERTFSPIREVRIMPSEGSLPRVVLPFAAWDRLMKERGWRWASGPERLFWAPAGEALFGFCTARTGNEETRYLMRIDLKQPKRDFVPVEEPAQILTASADARHWILQLGERYYRLNFQAKP